MSDFSGTFTDVSGGGEVLIQVTDGVLEVFQQGFVGSLRTPLAWVGVQVEAKKHETFVLSIGAQDTTSTAPTRPLYGSSVRVLGGPRYVHVDTAGEQAVRALFTQIAAATGRPIEP